MAKRPPVALSIEGDWSPRLHEVDVIELNPSVPHDALSAALRGLEIKANRFQPRTSMQVKDCLHGKGLRSPVVILNGNGLPRDVGRLVRLSGRVVLCVGSGLGSRDVAAAFLKTGARAFIASESAEMDGGGTSLFFATRFFYEIARNGVSVRDAWARAGALDRELGRFRLYVSRGGDCHRLERPVGPVRYTARQGVRSPYWMGKWHWTKVEWKPSPLVIDILHSARHPVPEPGLGPDVLAEWGVKANLHTFAGPRELTLLLKGKGLTAPLVLLMSHGYPDNAGGTGIIVRTDQRRHLPVVFGHDRIGRVIRLPGRLVISMGCGLGHPKTARAFLAGNLRGYIGERYSTDAWSKVMFIQQFLYDLGMNRRTVRAAWANAQSRTSDARLYPGGARIVEDFGRDPVVLRAPAMIEGFEGEIENFWISDPQEDPSDYLPSRVTPAPDGRSGSAFRLTFNFRHKPDPEVKIHLGWHGQRWINGGSILYDVYVPKDLVLQRPLRAIMHVVGEGGTCRALSPHLTRGWNHLRVPPLAIRGLTTMVRLGLQGNGRKDLGAVYFDNLRLEVASPSTRRRSCAS